MQYSLQANRLLCVYHISHQGKQYLTMSSTQLVLYKKCVETSFTLSCHLFSQNHFGSWLSW